MKSISEITNELIEKLGNWWESAVLMLPNFIIAILVMVAFGFLAKYARKGTKKLMSSASDNKAINNLIGRIIQMALIAVGLFMALGVMDLDKTVTSLLAGVGVIGLALGFAFQNTATNFISGVLMASDYPLRVGDLVETNGHFGIVERITLRYTTMRSFEGQAIVIPNKQVLENSLVNFTVNKERRVDVDCGVSYSDDLDKVEEVAIKAIDQLRDSDRPVEVMFKEFGDSSINFTLRFWLNDTENRSYVEARSNAVKALKKAFDKEGISIPFPIRTLELASKEMKVVKKGLALELNGHGEEVA